MTSIFYQLMFWSISSFGACLCEAVCLGRRRGIGELQGDDGPNPAGRVQSKEAQRGLGIRVDGDVTLLARLLVSDISLGEGHPWENMDQSVAEQLVPVQHGL